MGKLRQQSLSSDLDNRIPLLLPPIKEAIQAYLENNTELPIWELLHVIEHIRSLRIFTLALLGT